jgi:AcrR family transcriptional regulator
VARQGFGEFSLDELASRAGVTRNLLYHYFPRGRLDVAVAVIELAEDQLAADWAFDEALPLDQSVAANFARIAEHALRPTHAWRVHRRSSAESEPELRALVDRFAESAVAGIALNQFGTPDPPPIARLALRGYIAFAEMVLDESRAAGIPRDEVMRLLTDNLAATVRTVG